MADYPAPQSAENPAVTQESRNMALLVWIGTLFFGFIPSLILYLVKKDDPYVLDQSKEALNWSITAAIGYFASVLLAFIAIGFLTMMVVGLRHLVFCVLGAIKVSSGIAYRAPFALRLIK